jgi:DNA-binding transcriptional MerR regulator
MTDREGRGPLPSKLYFRIGEVAGLVGVEPHVLRYWEREFRSIRPTKSAKGQRVYSRRDVESLLRVRDLLYGQGFTIAGARRRLRDKDAVEPLVHDDEASVAAETLTLPAAAPVAAPLAPVVGPPEGGNRARVRRELEALRSEVEAFLTELGG